MNRIEIYLRHSGGRAILMMHVPVNLQNQFQQALQDGTIDGTQIPILFEAPVLPEWIPIRDDPKHMRLNIDQISIQFAKD